MFTFEELVFLLVTGLEIENKIVQFFDHKLVLFEAFIRDIEDRIFIGWFVVHVEHDMGLRDRHYIRDVTRFRFDSALTDRNMHISCISFE